LLFKEYQAYPSGTNPHTTNKPNKRSGIYTKVNSKIYNSEHKSYTRVQKFCRVRTIWFIITIPTTSNVNNSILILFLTGYQNLNSLTSEKSLKHQPFNEFDHRNKGRGSLRVPDDQCYL